MDSPAEYIRKLEVELRAERVARERAERERHEYRDQVHVLNERIGRMTDAALKAAATTTTALDRLQFYEAIVNAVVAWYRGEPDADEWLVSLARVETRRRETQA